MKKTLLWIAIAILALITDACTTAVEPVETSADIAVTVKTPTGNLSRATVKIPEGYRMECIMQLLDKDNVTVGTQKKVTIDATGKGSFTITGDERKTAVKALFWAQYIDGTGTSVYNTADLKEIRYSSTSMSLSNTAVTDAFCGKLDVLNANTSVTLARPFVNVCFVPSNPEKVSDAKNITVTYKAPSGYSVLNTSTNSETQLSYTNNSFNAGETPWFSTFVFAPANKTNLDNDINIVLGNGYNNFVINGSQIPLNANYKLTIKATLGDEILDEITVSVEINPNFNGEDSGSDTPDIPDTPDTPDTPGTAEFKVGAYIDATGAPVASATNAVAIVYKEGAFEDDNASKYPAQYIGKTIKGYAVALKNISDTRQYLIHEQKKGPTDGTVYTNGTQGTQTFITLFTGDEFVSTYNTFVTTTTVSGGNVSSWYVPTVAQLSTWLNMLYPTKDGSPATGSTEFKALFPETNVFEKDQTKSTYASCMFNISGNLMAVRLEKDDTSITVDNKAVLTNSMSNSTVKALCRPMLTIFE